MAAVLTIIGLFCAAAIRRGGKAAWTAMIILLAVPIILMQLPSVGNLVFWPPVIFLIALAALFGRTLMSGETPIIARFAALLSDDQLPHEELSYARRVTWVWVVLFTSLALESAVLAWLAPMELWSWFTNVFNYLIILLMFFVEYIVRVRKFPKRHSGFIAFIRSISNINVRALIR